MTRHVLPEGARASVSKRVEADDLASRLPLDPADSFPDVLATSRMIALMELAAARAMKPVLGDGELSVGVTVDVRHVAATPPGATVVATATLLRMEDKLYVFEVIASDDGGEIGRGIHRRAVILEERLVAGAVRRLAGAS